VPTLRYKWNVKFPVPYVGRWYAESPIGSRVFEEAFENISQLSKEATSSSFSSYLLVDAGQRESSTSSYIFVPSVYVVVTPGVSVEHINKFRESYNVSARTGVLRELNNKVRTVVSISVS
jgi:hypothetical protein